jgi:hypothetical protein
LENIKKGMARKSSKENSTSAGPTLGAQKNLLNNMMFPSQQQTPAASGQGDPDDAGSFIGNAR